MTTVPKHKDPSVPFERLGEYEVLAPISEGGMASVWLGRPMARPTELVALKVIRAEHARNKEFVAMLVDEAGIASRLVHPNLLSVHTLGNDGGQYFLVMELLRGHTLLETWKAAHARGKRLPFEVAAWIGARIADALDYAHERKDETGTPLNVVHRDVNPANIFLTKEGVPKLIDFGLAKARDRIASTAIGVVKGKLAYLSPEQTHGRPADRRSDVFALGVSLWEITLDRRLFMEGSDAETVRRVREAQVPDPTTLMQGYPPALAQALVRALAREPGDRWQTAGNLRDALDAFVRSTGRAVDTANVRALSSETFVGEQPAEWERLADEATADQDRTRMWEGRKQMADKELPTVPLQQLQRRLGVRLPQRHVLIAGGASAIAGSLLVALIARGCGGRDPAARNVEQRLARVEGVLGIREAGAAATDNALSSSSDAGVVVSADDDRSGPCALAKVAGYQAWQEAITKAKAIAGPAEAACADIWSDSKKQACRWAATAQVRAAQAARDAIIAGGGHAHETVNSVKDDPKNDAIARARTASQTAFAACDDDGGP
jgi:serine/threonine-protein kinase